MKKLLVLTIVLAMAGAANAGLIGYYDFEGDAQDSSGQGNHGVFMGNATIVNDATRGLVMIGDGNGDKVKVANNLAIQTMTETLAVSAWIKTASDSQRFTYPGGNIYWRPVIASTYTWDEGWMFGQLHYRWKLHVKLGYGVSVPWGMFAGNTTVDDHTWHHVVAIWNGSNVNLYVDGALDTSATGTGKIDSTTNDLFIGGGPNQSRTIYGRLDDVGIWRNCILGSGGITEADVVQGLYDGTYTPLTAPTTVPEPITLSLLGIGALSLLRRRR